VHHGHDVYVHEGAGRGSSIPDEDYGAARAKVLPGADAVWEAADLLLQVKEPVAEEFSRMREGQTLFTFLHLAASRECAQALLDSGVTGDAYETVERPDGSLPLLAPMSEVAGRLAPQVGAHPLLQASGGRGVLTNVTLPYVLRVVDLGWRGACRADAGLAAGLTTSAGACTSGPVAEALDLPLTPLADVLH
jgi:alanine dehydrogenase